ncbi:MAG: hypothetical protein QMD03_06080 [Syntrophales bacterium]|nr:hypothetical protein [Syntrophales bacterium]
MYSPEEVRFDPRQVSEETQSQRQDERGKDTDRNVLWLGPPPFALHKRTESSSISLVTGQKEPDTTLPDRIVVRLLFPPPTHRFKLLQQWEGELIEIKNEECTAILRDMSHPENPIEEITFSVAEISPSDISLAVPGSIFYLSIGYYDRIDGQRLRAASIRFRRLPEWTMSDFKRAEEEAEKIKGIFGLTKEIRSVERY